MDEDHIDESKGSNGGDSSGGSATALTRTWM